MPTHYHLIASFEEDMLTPAIRRLHRRYAGGFNRRHSRHGHVFDSPFTATEVVAESHAARLPDYIAENPTAATVAVEQLRHAVLLRRAVAVARDPRIWFGCAESDSS